MKTGSIIAALLSAGAISLTLQWKTSNVITGVMALLFFYFYEKQGTIYRSLPDKRKQVAAFAVSMLLTCFMCMHGLEYLDEYEGITGIGKVYTIVCMAGGYGSLFYMLLQWIYRGFDKLNLQSGRESKYTSRQIFFFVMILMFFCWLPFFLKNYPGVIISDSMDQIGQALAGQYGNHHPVVQTWILQCFLMIGNHWTGELTTGIALYCIAQMLVLSAIYAYFIAECYAHHVKKWVCVLLFLFYGILPYNVMYAINIWKDSLFSGALLLFGILLWKLMKQKEAKKITWIMQEIILVLSGCIVTLFRNNGFYAFLVVIPFVIVLCWKKNKQTIAAVVLVVLATLVIRGPVFAHFEVTPADTIESLSIPAQQIARTIANGGELTMEEQELLGKIIDIDAISDVYDEGLSDPIKSQVRQSGNQEYLEQNKAAYLNLWLHIGMRYPMNYIRAFLHQTEGYWYPDVQRWVYTEGICENSGGMVTEPKLPAMLSQMIGKGILWSGYTKVPFYGLLWSIGLAVWLTFILAGYSFASGKYKDLLYYLPMLALWGTLLVATPVNGEFRYIYAIFLCIPFYIIMSKVDAEDGI